MSKEEEYDNLCGVCFTPVDAVNNPRGRINSCNHLFCSHCINEWANNTNVCPSCKKRFNRIFTLKDGQEDERKVRKKNYRAWEELYDLDEDDEQVVADNTLAQSQLDQVCCAICNDHSNAVRMIFCDRRNCTYAAHLDCLHFEERPVTFVCASCQGALPSPLSAYEEEPAEEGKHAPTRREGKKIPMKLPIPQAPKRPRPPTQADDDLYFLRPTKHSLAAMQSLKSMKEEQEAISSKRDLYFMEKARRNYELSNDSAVTRQDGFSIDRSEILNSEKRRKLESRLIRQFAKDMLPVVLEQQAVQSARLVLDSKGGINYNPRGGAQQPEESDAWLEAVEKARVEVRHKLDAMVRKERVRQEKTLRLQAQQEAAALARLARSIASRHS